MGKPVHYSLLRASDVTGSCGGMFNLPNLASYKVFDTNLQTVL